MVGLFVILIYHHYMTMNEMNESADSECFGDLMCFDRDWDNIDEDIPGCTGIPWRMYVTLCCNII